MFCRKTGPEVRGLIQDHYHSTSNHLSPSCAGWKMLRQETGGPQCPALTDSCPETATGAREPEYAARCDPPTGWVGREKRMLESSWFPGRRGAVGGACLCEPLPPLPFPGSGVGPGHDGAQKLAENKPSSQTCSPFQTHQSSWLSVDPPVRITKSGDIGAGPKGSSPAPPIFQMRKLRPRFTHPRTRDVLPWRDNHQASEKGRGAPCLQPLAHPF